MSSDYCTEVIDPANPRGGKVLATIPRKLYIRYYKYYIVRYENLRAARHVLDHPRRIFAGVRQFSEGGWCFTGRPENWYIKEDVIVEFPGNLVFAVYLNTRMIVYECRAEDADKNDINCPANWQNRYKGLVWKSTS